MALVVGAVPLTAQEAPEASPVEVHAELGTLAGIDESHRWVTTTYPATSSETVRRTYQTTETTLVEGLGGIMAVGEIPPQALGRVVVVQFAHHGDHAVAQKLRFPVEREIMVTRGSIEGIDFDDEQLILENVDGTRELELGIGFGAMIDSPHGLMSLNELRPGHDVTVYYAEPATAYLVVVDG